MFQFVQCSDPCPDGTHHDHVAAAGAEQPHGLADQLQAVLADRLLAGQDQVGGADRLHPGQDQRHRYCRLDFKATFRTESVKVV